MENKDLSYHTAHNMAADVLAVQGAKASVVMLLVYLAKNIPISAPEWWKKHYFEKIMSIRPNPRLVV